MSDLKAILAEIESLEKAERQLASVNQELDREYKQLGALRKVVDQEYRDVEKLEKLSVKGLFHKVLGTKEEQLEQERQEYLQAFLKFQEYEKTLELLEFEQKVLSEKLSSKGNLQKRKTIILKQIEEDLIRSNTAQGQQLAELEQKILDEIHIKREINEALVVGSKASEMVGDMLSALKTASNWGTYDMMGGNSTASYMKHSSIDRAKALAYQTKHVLTQFERELGDVYGAERIQLNLNLDSFHRFTDIFFDNLITDWIIQSKIQNSLSSVRAANDKIQRILNSLKRELVKIDDTIDKIEAEKKRLIMDSAK